MQRPDLQRILQSPLLLHMPEAMNTPGQNANAVAELVFGISATLVSHGPGKMPERCGGQSSPKRQFVVLRLALSEFLSYLYGLWLGERVCTRRLELELQSCGLHKEAMHPRVVARP